MKKTLCKHQTSTATIITA